MVNLIQHDKSNKEIAELYDMSIKAVGYHITKTIKALRIVLKDYLVHPYLSPFKQIISYNKHSILYISCIEITENTKNSLFLY